MKNVITYSRILTTISSRYPKKRILTFKRYISQQNSIRTSRNYKICQHNIVRSMAVPKVIIDTDAGLDDALAIFMVLAAHKRGELEVVGITTVNGNTTVDNVNINVLRILDTAQLPEIPVYSGCWTPLVHSWEREEAPFHGHDGFGDAQHPKPPPSKERIQEQPAAEALVEIVKKNEGSLTLAALGPLTNLAIAMRLDPHFTQRFASIYIMGGNTKGQGNVSMCGEFNFYCDPEAARVVLEDTKSKIHLVPWEFCLENVNIPYEYRLELGALQTPEARLLNLIEAKVLNRRQFVTWITCDQLATAWMIHDIRNKKNDTALLRTTKECYATVNLEGICRGQMVIDHMNMLKKTNNLIIMEEINVDLYKRYLRSGFGGKL